MLLSDIAQGRENFAIPVFNEVDDDLPPPFEYISKDYVFNTLVAIPLEQPIHACQCSSCGPNCECVRRWRTFNSTALQLPDLPFDADGLIKVSNDVVLVECTRHCHSQSVPRVRALWYCHDRAVAQIGNYAFAAGSPAQGLNTRGSSLRSHEEPASCIYSTIRASPNMSPSFSTPSQPFDSLVRLSGGAADAVILSDEENHKKMASSDSVGDLSKPCDTTEIVEISCDGNDVRTDPHADAIVIDDDVAHPGFSETHQVICL